MVSLWWVAVGQAVTGAVMYRFGYHDGKMFGFKLGIHATKHEDGSR